MTDDRQLTRDKSPARRYRNLWWLFGTSLFVILGVALLPVASVAVAGLVAEAAGCTLNEARAHPCVIAGLDWGGLLYTMGVLGWLMLATIPIGGALLAFWAVALLFCIGWRIFRG